MNTSFKKSATEGLSGQFTHIGIAFNKLLGCEGCFLFELLESWPDGFNFACDLQPFALLKNFNGLDEVETKLWPTPCGCANQFLCPFGEK